eukprot:5630276-Pleurochrysis_carterae.AAC.4
MGRAYFEHASCRLHRAVRHAYFAHASCHLHRAVRHPVEAVHCRFQPKVEAWRGPVCSPPRAQASDRTHCHPRRRTHCHPRRRARHAPVRRMEVVSS